MPKSQFVSCLQARNMVSKGCIYHLVWVRDMDSETPSLESVPIVNEYLEVFLDDLPGVLQKEKKILILTFSQIRNLFLFLLIEWLR